MDNRMECVETWLQGQSVEGAAEAVEEHLLTEDTSNLDSSPTECIPGVPEDVFLEILSKAPRGAAFSFRHVSKAWKRAAGSEVIRQNKASRGNLEQWLFVQPEFPKGGPFRALDPSQDKWHSLPPLPASSSPAPTDSSLASTSSSSSSSSPMTSPDTSPASSPHRPGSDGPPLEGFACSAVAGKLLLIGGAQATVTADGRHQKTVTSAVWEFDPAAWEWASAPPMQTKRSWAAAATMLDRFVVVSGGQGQHGFLKSVEVYDAVLRTWCHVSSMALARCSHRSVVVGGRLFVIGGEVERHDVAHLQPRAGPQGGQPQAGGALGVFRNLPGRLRPGNFFRPAAAAGQVAARQPMGNASMEVYSLDSDTWTYLPDSWLNGAKVPCPVASVDGKLYAVHRSSVHVFNEETATWQNVGDTPGRDSQGRPLQVVGFGAAEVSGKLVLFGGLKEVWIGRSKLTQQNLGSVYAWQPPKLPRVREEGQEAGGGSMFRAESAIHSIMLWKDMPPMVGAGGPVLAAAVLSF